MKLPTIDRIIEVVGRDEMTGFCLECGSESDCVEPDAQRYHCANCGLATVYGAEDVLLRMAAL